MWPMFADPKTGFVFKRIVGAEDRKHLLIGLLNAKLLSARGVTEAHRARIAACEDAAELDRWIDRAIAGASPAELFDTAG